MLASVLDTLKYLILLITVSVTILSLLYYMQKQKTDTTRRQGTHFTTKLTNLIELISIHSTFPLISGGGLQLFKRVKRKITEWTKSSALYVTDKWLPSVKCKEFLQIYKKKISPFKNRLQGEELKPESQFL